jgi:hypothetical protein
MRHPSWNSNPRKIAALLAPFNGKPLNTLLIARRLGVSRPTALSRIFELQRYGLLRLLPCSDGHRRPLLFLYDCLGADPASFRGFCLELVSRILSDLDPGAKFFWWKTGRVRRIDLLAIAGGKRIGFCFSTSQLCPRREWYSLSIGCKQGVIQHGFLLHCGHRAFRLGRAILALPLNDFAKEPRAWIMAQQTSRQASEAMRRINKTNDCFYVPYFSGH